MKFKLSPELSYVIGFYSQRKTSKGIGIKGGGKLLATFSKECLKLGLSPSKNLLFEKNSVYFYNSKLKKFFEKVLKEASDRFIFLNDYSSNYFAGIFDSYGKLEKNNIIVGKYRIRDAVALQKLGFPNRKKGKDLVLEGRKREFLMFIKDNLKIKKESINKVLKNVLSGREIKKRN